MLRKKIKKVLCITMLAALCNMSAITANAASKPEISKTQLTLNIGSSKKLKIHNLKSGKKVKWMTKKKTVATVNEKGKVTAKNTGSTTIVAKVGKKKFTCKVKVRKPVISNSEVKLSIGETKKLKVQNISSKVEVKWSSTKKKIATVNKKGVVKAKNAGKTTIIAKINGKKYTAKVVVKKITSKKEMLKAYKEVLDKYYTALVEDWDWDKLDKAKLSYVCRERNENGMGYSFVDIDNNGIPELLISESGSGEVIYDLYTLVDGKIVQLAMGWGRKRHYLCSDYTIAMEGSSGAAYSQYCYYSLKNGSTLSIKEAVFSDEVIDYEMQWVYTTSDDLEDENYNYKITSDRLNREDYILISGSKAWEIINSYRNKYMSISFVPFSNYKN